MRAPSATPRMRFLRLGTPLLAALALATMAVPAQAQLGGLMKKAKEKVAKEVGDKSGANAALDGEEVKFDAVTVELTAERIEGVIRGLQESRAKLAGRPALVARRDAAAEKLSEHLNKHGAEIDRAQEQRSKINSCRDDAFRKLQDANTEAMATKMMSSPALQQKMQAISQRLAVAQQKGDAGEIQKLQGELQALVAPTAADSASVSKSCGAVPGETAAEKEAKSLENQRNQLDQELRSMEEGANAEASKSSGLSPRAFAMARERMEMYLSRAKSNSRQRGLTSAEITALSARRSDIAQAM